MSRPLLLIICDFLLLSLLAIARFDLPEAGEPAERERAPEREDDAGEEELVEVLRLALEAERAEREQAQSNLEQTQQELQQRLADLAQREQQVVELDERRAELEAERARLRETQEQTRQALSQAETRLSSAEERLQQTRQEQRAIEEAEQATRERLAAIQEELQRREQALAQATENISDLESERRVLEEERRALSTELRVREAEKAILANNLTAARTEVQTIREEKRTIQEQAQRLAEGVSTLAQSSQQIEEQIRDSRPRSANVIYADYLENRVRVRFEGVFSTLFGTRSETFEAHTVIARLAGESYALVHVDATPFTVDTTGGIPREVRGSVRLGREVLPVREVRFLRSDPRILAIPVSQEAVEAAGIRPVRIENDPLRFAEAVVVGQREGYYGETAFRLNPDQPEHLLMENKILSRLIGEFAPARGDLVFSGAGELLGLMASGRLAALVRNPAPVASIRVGGDYESSEAEDVIAEARRAAREN